MRALALLLVLMALSPATGQEPSPVEGTRQPVWRCELPGGTYTVALRAIVSVSRHEYITDGVAHVTEVNVDTTGSLSVRFYFLEPVAATSPVGLGQSTLDKAQELAREALDRTGQQDLWRKVVKNYPTTTHAKTVEYRIESRDDLDKLFNSADTAFRQMRPATFRPR